MLVRLDQGSIHYFSPITPSGSEGGLGTALEHTLPGGQISVVALFGRRPSLDINIAVRRQIRILGSYASVPTDYRAAVELLAASDGGLERALVTALPLADSVSALEATSEGRVVKAVLVP